MAKKTASPNRTSATEMRRRVELYIDRQQNNTFNYKQVAHAIDALTGPQQRLIAEILADMAASGDIIETTPGKYKAPQRNNVTTGTFVRRSNDRNS